METLIDRLEAINDRIEAINEVIAETIVESVESIYGKVILTEDKD